jgi:hypothetical protein
MVIRLLRQKLTLNIKHETNVTKRQTSTGINKHDCGKQSRTVFAKYISLNIGTFFL